MTALAARLDRYWFAPGSLRDLAVVRMVVALAAFLWVIPDSLGWTTFLATAPADQYVPLPSLKVLLLPLGWGARPSLELLTALYVIAHVAAFLAFIGFLSRLSMAVLAYAACVIVVHSYSYGKFHHPETLIIIMMGVLALVPIGRALSVDALLARWRRARAAQAFTPADPSDDLSIHARWPLRLGQWLLVIAYGGAALAKLAHGNLDWANGTTLAYYLAYDGIAHDRPLGLVAAQFGVLMVALSVFTLLYEGTFAVAALVTRLTWVYIAAGVGMHIGIWFLQGAPFFTFMALYVVFLPQLRENAAMAAARFRRWRSRRARAAVIYDGLCPLCIRTMAALDEFDAGRRVEYVDLEADWERAQALAPGLTRDDALAAMHVVLPDGRRLRGFDAFRELARRIPLLWPAVPLLYAPGVAPVGRRTYAWVAERRPRRLCRDVCEL